MEMQNTLKLDLALLAKNQYNVHHDHYVTAARRICAAHIFMSESGLSHADTIRWLLREFCTETDQPIIPVNKVVDTLIDVILDKDQWLRDLAGESDPGASHRCIESLLSLVRLTQVRQGDVVLHPSLMGEVDPQVVKLLEDLTPRAPGNKDS